MFTEKIISRIGYTETTLPFRGFYELIENINSTELNVDYNSSLAGQIENEKAFDLNLIPDSIKRRILQGCKEYIKTFGHNKFAFKRNENYQLNFQDCWINFQKKYEYNPVHSHSGDLVFVIWIQIPYNLNDELSHKFSVNSNTKVASKFQFIGVSNKFSTIGEDTISVDKSFEGKMIIFHAGMEHIVYPFFTSDEYRISMSGNLEIVFENEL